VGSYLVTIPKLTFTGFLTFDTRSLHYEEIAMARKPRVTKPVDTIWEIPDSLWAGIAIILVEHYPPARTGRPMVDLRRILNGIIHRMRSGTQWNHLPREFGSSSTLHRWFQRFCEDGVFEAIWAQLVDACDDLGGVSWEWQAADAAMGKARFGGTRSVPTRRIEPNQVQNAA
jgi:putative transposase